AKVNEKAPEAAEFMAFVIFKSTKPNTIAVSALLGALLCDPKRVAAFRPSWFDVPMLVWCVMPLVSDVQIDPRDDNTKVVSFYDAFSMMRDQILVWGVPYYLGRVYFTDAAKLFDLSVGILVGGLLYAPICLIEGIKFPFVHERIYGFFPGDA